MTASKHQNVMLLRLIIAAYVVAAVAIPSSACRSGDVTSADRNRADEYFKSAKDNLKLGNIEDTAAELMECIRADPTEKRCVTLLKVVNDTRAELLIAAQRRLDPHDLMGRIALVDSAEHLSSVAEYNRALSDSLRARLAHVSAGAAAHFDSAEATGHGLGKIPPDLQPYVWHLPLIFELQQAAISRFLGRVERDARDQGNFIDAFKRVSVIREEGLEYPHAASLAVTATAALSDSLSLAGPALALQAVDHALMMLPDIEREAAVGTADSLRNVILTATAHCIGTAFPAEWRRHGVPGARLIREHMTRSHPLLESLPTSTWNTSMEDMQFLPFSISTPQQPEGCSEGSFSKGLLSAVSTAGRHIFRVSSDPDVQLRINLADPQCDVATRSEDIEVVQSEYVARYQQNSNPQYVQLQNDLSVAIEAARRAANNYSNDPNFFTGLASGLADGRVKKLQSQLRNTDPYYDSPVILPYSATRTRAIRTADVSVTVEISDAATGYRDAAWSHVSLAVERTGIKGVSASDHRHLRETDAKAALPSEYSLMSEAIAACVDSVVSQLPPLLEKALMSRAAKAQSERKPIETLGTLLLAHDCQAVPSALPAGSYPAREVNGTSLSELTAFDVSKIHIPASMPLRKVTAPSVQTSRTEMIQRSLNAVVTIETDEGSGSGFIVEASGLILTNAHVVSGSGRIVVTTQGGDILLARILKVVEKSDLALIQVPVQGLPVLSLGGDDPPPVGSDVVTIGSPLGLQGTVTRGILSGIRRVDGVTLLQIDAAINPGNSGGPLLTEDGRVIGINSSRMRPSAVESMGFAVAIAEARKAFGGLLASRP